MSEQNWLGNDDIDPEYLAGVVARAVRWDAAADVDVIEADPLGCPLNAYMGIGQPCDCPEFAVHSDDCPWTPIFAQLAEELPWPIPWGPIILPFTPIYPRFVLSDGLWTLPAYPVDLVDPEPLPPWAIRQENPEK